MDMRHLLDITAGSKTNTSGDRPFEFFRSLAEAAPPGKKAERFIKKRKKDFQDRYGDDWESVLYATAWKLFGNKKKKKG